MVKKIFLGLFAFSFGLYAVVSVYLMLTEPDSENFVGYIMMFLFCAVAAFFLGRACQRTKTKGQMQQEAQDAQRQLSQQRARRAAEAEQMTALTMVPMPGSLLSKPGEICYYHAPATALVVKNQVVGRTGSHTSSSVRVMKGVSIHSGSSRSQSVRGDVGYTYPGYLTITSQRFVMTGDKGFEMPAGKLTAVTYYGDYEGVLLQFGGSSHTLLMDDPATVVKIVHLMHEAHQ